MKYIISILLFISIATAEDIKNTVKIIASVDQVGRLLVRCINCPKEKDLLCSPSISLDKLKCASKGIPDPEAPYLTDQCCTDIDCKEKDWCGVTKVDAQHGDYVRLMRNKEIKPVNCPHPYLKCPEDKEYATKYMKKDSIVNKMKTPNDMRVGDIVVRISGNETQQDKVVQVTSKTITLESGRVLDVTYAQNKLSRRKEKIWQWED